MNLLGMFFFIYSGKRVYNEEEGAYELLDLLTRWKIDTKAGECYGVQMSRRKTCMCELDYGFTTYGIRDRDFYGRTNMPKSCVSNKVTKHEKACSDNQHVFISFTFDIFGFLAPKVVGALHRVQRVVQSNVMSYRYMNVVFTMIILSSIKA